MPLECPMYSLFFLLNFTLHSRPSSATFSRSPLPISRAAWAPSTHENLSVHPFHLAPLQIHGVWYIGETVVVPGRRSWSSCSYAWLDACETPQKLIQCSELWFRNAGIGSSSGDCLIVPWQGWGSKHFCMEPKYEYSLLTSWMGTVGLMVVCELLT